MFFLIATLALSFENNNPLRLWYTLPTSEMPINRATYGSNNAWQQNTLPIGNGFIGANIYGEIKDERITFNELTFREGGPSTSRPNYNGGNINAKGQNGATLRRIQQLFAEHKNEEASAMCNELVGERDGYGTYLEFGEIKITFNLDKSQATDYVRFLDLDEAITYVQYKYQQSTISREYFISHPDNVFVIQINSTNGPIPDFTVWFGTYVNSASKSVTSNGNTIILSGDLDDNQLRYHGQITVSTTTGQVTANNGELKISGSSQCFLYITAATDFKMEHPKYRTGETAEQLSTRVKKMNDDARNKGFQKVRDDHIADYQNIFNRVTLDLGQQPSRFTTNEQLENYKSQTAEEDQDRDLEVLLFQYGRYLTIGSSREDGILPSNLQGVWNDLNSNVPWASDYHINVNLQMNYWPNYVTNMAETALPLIDFIDKLRPAGRVTAEIYMGVKSDAEHPENGFLAHTQVTPFGWTCPGWDFSWGWSTAAVPWILMNIFDYYLFTKDDEILRDKIYPMLKEECTFFDQIMVYNEDYGRLVTSPAYSPEHGPRTPGNTYEQAVLWQHYNNTIRAAQALNVDSDLIQKWNETINKLKPIEIGDSGQIKEWYTETTLGSIGEKGHRHISHLLGLYPGDLINIDNKEYMDAAKVSLNHRGDISTGWAMGHRINAWARTGDGNRAYKLVHNLLTEGIYNNLWDTHPPFQIDGNFGATSGIAEMLLQSNRGYIDILPSLPDVWSTGKFTGFIARGNIEVDCKWQHKDVLEIVLKPKFSGDLIVQSFNISSHVITDKEGNSVSFTNVADNRIKINGVSNNIYTIINPNPRKPTPTPTPLPVPVSVSVESMKTNLDLNKNCNEDISCEKDRLNPQCGKKCWSSKSASDYMEFSFKGVKFEVYGSRAPANGKFTLILDGKNLQDVDLYQSSAEHRVLVFTSDVLDYGDHTIRVQGIEGSQFEIHKFTFWPDLNAYRINVSNFKTKGEWTEESDRIGGVRAYTKQDGASKSASFEGSKVWLYGSRDPLHGKLNVEFAGKKVEVNERSNSREDTRLIYESDKEPFNNYTLTISRVENPILINYAYFLHEPTEEKPDPTEKPPEQTVPPQTIPAQTIPPQTVPAQTIPQQTIPPQTVPQQTVPAQTVPQQTIPPQTVPAQTVPPQTIPPQTVPPATLPAQTPKPIPPKTVPPKTIPPKTVPQKTVPQPTSPLKTNPPTDVSEPSKNVDNSEAGDGEDKETKMLYIILIVFAAIAIIIIIVIIVVVAKKKARESNQKELKMNLFDSTFNL
ncbi:hypothetical protein M9Y10_029862 [Tritrichomonas musculus]|uniref:Glycosyl hydrolase family 95 N-terminal domain-containing protein n=1 Tax=Tritrichomonas musculus TaxID=1915356 RepID=A0ABR2KP53_9EUKA